MTPRVHAPPSLRSLLPAGRRAGDEGEPSANRNISRANHRPSATFVILSAVGHPERSNRHPQRSEGSSPKPAARFFTKFAMASKNAAHAHSPSAARSGACSRPQRREHGEAQTRSKAPITSSLLRANRQNLCELTILLERNQIGRVKLGCS